MYRDANGDTVIGFRDIANFLRRPIPMFILGLIACIMAFNMGIKYSRAHLEIHSITHNLAFIEIAGEENMYELDWYEPETLYFNN